MNNKDGNYSNTGLLPFPDGDANATNFSKHSLSGKSLGRGALGGRMGSSRRRGADLSAIDMGAGDGTGFMGQIG